MAIAVNYAKAFRVKNRVINILEQYQFSGSQAENEKALSEMDKYLDSVSYIFRDDDTNLVSNCKNSGENPFLRHGVCIASHGDEDARYYVVTTYLSVDFLFFDINLILPIKGETKTIVY